MSKSPVSIPVADIMLDNDIYPRASIDHKRVGIFAENMRDGFEFEPIHVQELPHEKGKYRILDGAHRWQAYKATGAKEVLAKVVRLDGKAPLLYAAQQAIGPRQLNDAEAKDTARRAYQNNPKLSSGEIGRAIGRSRQAVDSYIADLRAANQLEINLKVYRMNKLGLPQYRISERLKLPQQTISRYLPKMPMMAKWVNSDLKRGFTVPQVAEKHGWPEPLVWSLRLEGKSDVDKCRELQWEIRTLDPWDWTDCDKRFGDEWPERIPAQLIAHILFFFSEQKDFVLDPMAGGGVVPDTCLALDRQCWSFDMEDRPETRPEIEPYYWDFNNLKWPVKGKTGPDLIIFDPPHFSKESEDYDKGGISGLSRKGYLEFLEDFLGLARKNSKRETRMAMISADWRDYKDTPAIDETGLSSILIRDYLELMKKAGWSVTRIIQAPMSSEKFQADEIDAMRKKRILGVTGRHVVVGKKKGN
jgi:hypothetical protein